MVDGGTGFGGPLNVQGMVRALVAMGAKAVIDTEEHAVKIRAAADARGDTPFVITARTDAMMTDGLDEAIRRARLYEDAGADVLFVEGADR